MFPVENLTWFSEQLDLLRTHPHSPKVSVSIYVTRAPSSTSDLAGGSGSGSDDNAARADSASDGTGSPPLSPIGSDSEKDGPRIPASVLRWPSTTGDLEKEMEGIMESRVEHNGATTTRKDLATASVSQTFLEHPIKAGRPDTASLIRDAVRSTPQTERVLVAACGPDGLMRVVRDTTARLIVGDGPAVELHCEQFGW